jgi:hypothetical protein
MSERETSTGDSIQRWKGVNQRTQPTLVKDDFFTSSRGLYFGPEGVIRLFGKRLVGKLDGPVFGIFVFGAFAMVQTTTKLWSIPIDEITSFAILQYPSIPGTPIVYNIDYTSLTVQTPPSYPAHTLSFRLEERFIEVSRTGIYADIPQSWADIGGGEVVPSQVFNRTGHYIGGIYEYRMKAENDVGITYSEVARVQLLWAPPTINVPTYSDIDEGDFKIVVPAIPSVTVFTILMLTGADPDDLGDYSDIGGTCEPLVASWVWATDLAAISSSTTYTFRFQYTLKKADNTFVDITTNYSTVTTATPAADVRVLSTGDVRVLSDGDTRTL